MIFSNYRTRFWFTLGIMLWELAKMVIFLRGAKRHTGGVTDPKELRAIEDLFLTAPQRGADSLTR